MSLQNLTLRELCGLESVIPGLCGFPTRILARTYDDFIGILYADIDHIVRELEENPELLKNDGEDRLTIEIKRGLVYKGYNATHDSKHGGHTDLLVRKGEFVWIGEAKIHSDYNYIWEGFLQLTTRYSTGGVNQKDGGIIIYIRINSAKAVMDEWLKQLSQKGLPGFSSLMCDKNPIAFFSSHTHDKSGLPFRIRHIPVMLHFEPKDKSGRKRKRSIKSTLKTVPPTTS